MTETSPRRSSIASRTLLYAALLLGLVVACLVDMPVFRYMHAHPARWVEKDPGHLLRCGGYLPTWLLVAAVIVLHDRTCVGRWCFEAWRRGAMLVAGAACSGIVAEVSKLLFRRQRGDASHTWYGFRPLWDRPLTSAGLSLPSSHAMVAFGAAFILCRLYPGARPVLVAFAVGTGIVRVASGAHFVSDVYVAALLAWPAVRLTERLFDRLTTPTLNA